jgi:uncharacterized repeat protein (TIGR02543 family)
MATENSGSLLSVSGNKAWRGEELTNGFLMRNADGRVAAITQSGTLDLTGNQAVTQAAPYGKSLYQFAGVIKYEPGWAISHPVQNWGIPSFSKFTSITRGIVGYKFSQKSGQSSADYLAFLKGDKTKVTAIDTFAEWMVMLHGTSVIGSNLYLLVSLLTGFPSVIVGVSDRHAITVPVGHMLIGQAVVFEPENGMIGFELDGDVVYGGVAANEAGHFAMTFAGNGSTGGTVPVDATAYAAGATVTAPANSGTLVRTGYSFVGWNTLANLAGTFIAPGATFAMGAADKTLYAHWIAEFTVTYAGNGSTSGTVPVQAGTFGTGDPVTAKTNSGTLALAAHTFGGWNTEANGSGITYPANAIFPMGEADLILYAVWVAV